MAEPYQYLQFHIKVLNVLGLWPNDTLAKTPKWKQWQSYIVFISVTPCCLSVFAEAVNGFSDPDKSLAEQAQTLLACFCIFSMLELMIFFLKNAEAIRDLINSLTRFAKYSSMDMTQVDGATAFYSKMFMIYSVFGMLMYAAMPFAFVRSCERDKPARMRKYGIPCGIIFAYRLPFAFDRSPLYEIVMVYTAYLASMTSITIIVITTLICAVVSHVVAQLKELRRQILAIPTGEVADIERTIYHLIRYHSTIISFTDEVNGAFGSQLVAHRTFTCFIISMLGFVLLTVSNVGEYFRFTVHLIGCLLIVFVICYFGQLLIDESLAVAEAAYTIDWHTKPIPIQKSICVIMMRAQKPLLLKFVKLEAFSYDTFVGVLRTAYSVFTLMLNVRK